MCKQTRFSFYYVVGLVCWLQVLVCQTVGFCDWVSSSVGARFVPHIINVHTGEDVTMKVMSFSQHGPRAICILSANGVISSVTLR
ncbi:putative AT-hook motif nuclear-localized protein [Helianthus annuus]|nr:putative AT-hook motif nuclear-localized protein [Helianthus annuus]